MWFVCLVVSFACLVLAALLPALLKTARLMKKHKFGIFHSLFAGVFVSTFVMFLAVHGAVGTDSFLEVARTILLSFFNSMQVFAIGCEFNVVRDSLPHCPEAIRVLYEGWASVLFFLAPIFSFGYILSLFKNLFEYVRYLRCYNRDVYVFSELNERSLVLAGDIKGKDKRAVVVFTDVFEENEESTYELIEQARKLGALCFKKDILVVDFNRHSPKKAVSFFAIGSNETENLNQSIKLIERYRNRDNTHVYVFSKRVESALLLTSVDKGAVKVRRINEVQSLIYRVLYENGNDLFESATPLPDGQKKLSAVIVGMGAHGTEMVKALAWFGQMDGFKLEINAFDKDRLAKEKFIALAPELMSDDYNGVEVEGEAQYTITIHPGMDVSTNRFVKKFSQIKDASYVLVALGDDDINIATAVELRMYCERMGIHPVIQAIVYNSQQKRALAGIKNYKKQEYNIDFIGDLESSYTADVIIDSELEDEALAIHQQWGASEEAVDQFWSYEYNYRSSMASAVHKKVREKRQIAGSNKTDAELTAEEREIIEVLEHRRWNAYMRSEGYVFSGSKDPKSRNDLGKMHHDLVDFSSLSDEDKRKDSRVATKRSTQSTDNANN